MQLVGCLILLLAESRPDSKSIFAGIPSLDDNKPKSYMLFAGRILIVLIYLVLLSYLDFNSYFYRSLMDLNIGVLLIMVFIGFKTKLCTLVMVFYFSVTNIIYNSFWILDVTDPIYDILKSRFFGRISVIGGLLYIVVLGPGGVSFDERKKHC